MSASWPAAVPWRHGRPWRHIHDVGLTNLLLYDSFPGHCAGKGRPLSVRAQLSPALGLLVIGLVILREIIPRVVVASKPVQLVRGYCCIESEARSFASSVWPAVDVGPGYLVARAMWRLSRTCECCEGRSTWARPRVGCCTWLLSAVFVTWVVSNYISSQ